VVMNKMKTQVLKENLAKLSPEEIDRAAGLLVTPLASLFRHYKEWIAKSKSDSVAVSYIYQIATDKRFKSSAKRQKFLSLLKDSVVFHLSNLFASGNTNNVKYASENTNNVKYATEYAIKFTKIAGPQDHDVYINILAKNLNNIETALYSIMHDTMGDKTIGASRVYNEVTDILKNMKELGFVDIELKLRSKYTSEKILKTSPAKPSTWGHYLLYDILDAMAEGKDTVVNRLEYLSSEAQEKILGLKDYFLYREWYYMTDGRVSEYVKFIIDVKYPAMKRFGLPWPELDFKYSSAAERLEFYKTPIIKMLLKSLKGENKINIPMTVADIRKSGINWPELERIEQAMSRKSITEDIDEDDEELYYEAIDLMVDLYDVLKSGHFANAVSILAELGRLYQEEGVYLPKARDMVHGDRQVIRKIDGIYGLLDDISDDGRREMLRAILHIPSGIQITNLISVLDDFGVEWPELDRIDRIASSGVLDRTPIAESFEFYDAPYNEMKSHEIESLIEAGLMSKLSKLIKPKPKVVDRKTSIPKVDKPAGIDSQLEFFQIERVRRMPTAILDIPNPSLRVQIAALIGDPPLIADAHVNRKFDPYILKYPEVRKSIQQYLINNLSDVDVEYGKDDFIIDEQATPIAGSLEIIIHFADLGIIPSEFSDIIENHKSSILRYLLYCIKHGLAEIFVPKAVQALRKFGKNWQELSIIENALYRKNI
jgi:hypothetical protein